MEKEFLDLYDPKNAPNLTPTQVAAMETFTKAQLKALADKYKNDPLVKPYLILKDTRKKDNQQIGQPATWPSLFALHEIGQTNFVAMSFKSIYDPKVKNLKQAKPQDLTASQAQKELKGGNEAKPTTGLQTGGEQQLKAKTPEQIAAEEETLVDDGKVHTLADGKGTGVQGDNGTEQKPVEKPLVKMNKAELSKKYEEVLKEVPEPGTTNAQLIAAIQAKQK